MQQQSAERHSLTDVITGVVCGQYPSADGSWSRTAPWIPGLEAVVAFAGHAVFAVGEDVSDGELAELGADGFGGAHDPRLITTLVGPGGWIDSLDVLLARGGTGGHDSILTLVDRPDLADHPRVRLALDLRESVRVLGLPDPSRTAVVTVSRGIAGMFEISFELEPERRGTGSGGALLAAALTAVPSNRVLLAAVAPGNAASLRLLLAAGFIPLGSVQLFRRAPTITSLAQLR